MTATARPLPLATWVPKKTLLARSASGAAGDSAASASLSTGKDSPVSTDSSTSSPLDASSRQSAGTRLPADSSTTSPGTTSATGTWQRTPSRSTVAFTWTLAISAATSRPARYSWAKPSSPDAAMIAMMIAPSVTSPTTIDTTVATIRISMIGLVNCLSSALGHRACRWCCPCRGRRAAASAAVRPSSLEPSRARRPAAGSAQSAAVPGGLSATAEGRPAFSQGCRTGPD